MHGPHVHAEHLRRGDSRPDLPVGGVARLDRHFLPLVDFDHGRNVGMPAVMPLAGLVLQALRAVDADFPRHRPSHSTFAPEETTTFAHFAVSAAMTLPKSSGVPARGLPPSSARRSRILGSASARLVSALTLSMTSRGVP